MKDRRQTKHKAQSKSTSKVIDYFNQLRQKSRKKPDHRSASAAEPKRLRSPRTTLSRKDLGRVIPDSEFIESWSVEGGSSGWSTVSCHTVVGDDSSTRSKRRRTCVASRVPGSSSSRAAEAALLALNNYFGAYSQTAAGDHHDESTTRRSNRGSKLVVLPMSPYQQALDDGGLHQTTRARSARATPGRSSVSSGWSTVSYRTLSRPPSSEFDGELIVDEEDAAVSTVPTPPEQVLRAINGRNSDQRPCTGDVTALELRRGPQNYRHHVVADWTSSFMTDPSTAGHCGIYSPPSPRRTSTAELQVDDGSFTTGLDSCWHPTAASRYTHSEHQVGSSLIGGRDTYSQRRLELMGSGDGDNSILCRTRRQNAVHRVCGSRTEH